MFMKNKYTGWYYHIIGQARNRQCPDGYHEKHHIIPECLGGMNDFSNIVSLTYREHYIVHWLLTKMTTGNARIKMLWALSMMARRTNQERSSPSWLYALAKKSVRAARIGSKASEETKIKMRKANAGKNNGFYGKKHSIETRNKIRETKTGVNLGENHHFFGKKHSAEAIDKIRKSKIGRLWTKEAKDKLKGRKVSEGTRVKLSKARTGALSKKPYSTNKLGLKGVSKHTYGFTAQITINRKQKYLGFFKTIDEAVLAYNVALSQIK